MKTLHLGQLAHLRENPFQEDTALQVIAKGALVSDETGKLVAVGEAQAMITVWPDAQVVDHGDAWLIPGLIDGHIHFPQFYATAASANHLLDWLNIIFPAEATYAEPDFATQTAQAFTARLLASGTTTAMVFGSQFPAATRALFRAARTAGLRLIAGMTLMDRDAPESLFTSAETAYAENKALIDWVENEPLLDYAITPRFGLSCTDALLDVCRALVKDHPNCWLQTHINENSDEIETTARLFPQSRHYLDIYATWGLLTPRTVLAHNIHAGEDELRELADLGCSVVHCPNSNMFLGSGLFPMARHLEQGIPLMVGTDVGGGTGFSMLEELAATYKVQQLQQNRLNAAQLLYLGTLGAARALHMDDRIGNFVAGKQADFLVFAPRTDSYLAQRLNFCQTDEERLFALILLGRSQHIRATYVAGQCVHQRPRSLPVPH